MLHRERKKGAREARVGIYPLLVGVGSVGPVMWGLQEECSFGMRSLSGTQIFSTSVTSDLDLADMQSHHQRIKFIQVSEVHGL